MYIVFLNDQSLHVLHLLTAIGSDATRNGELQYDGTTHTKPADSEGDDSSGTGTTLCMPSEYACPCA